ncbi:MAG TPA: hypothetical protein VMH47_07815 [Gaiellaceae bacterium]|nr:hypothetical protein [Gaiellaceae bacterium]
MEPAPENLRPARLATGLVVLMTLGALAVAGSGAAEGGAGTWALAAVGLAAGLAAGYLTRGAMRPGGGGANNNRWWFLAVLALALILLRAPQALQTGAISVVAGYLVVLSAVMLRRYVF